MTPHGVSEFESPALRQLSEDLSRIICSPLCVLEPDCARNRGPYPDRAGSRAL